MVAGLFHHLSGVREPAVRIVTEAGVLVDDRSKFARQRQKLRRSPPSRAPIRQATRIQER